VTIQQVLPCTKASEVVANIVKEEQLGDLHNWVLQEMICNDELGSLTCAFICFAYIFDIGVTVLNECSLTRCDTLPICSSIVGLRGK